MINFQQMIIKAILEDGSLKYDEGDWWTSHTDEDGNVYDINVFDKEFADIADDEFMVSVYDCHLRDDGLYETDYEGEGYPSFKVKKDKLIRDIKNQVNNEQLIKLDNNCTNPILAEWNEKVWDYDQVNETMINKHVWESLNDYIYEAEQQAGILITESKKNSENLYIRIEYSRHFDIMAFLFPDTGYCLLLIESLPSEDYHSLEFYGLVTIKQFFDYMDSLPQLKKRLIK